MAVGIRRRVSVSLCVHVAVRRPRTASTHTVPRVTHTRRAGAWSLPASPPRLLDTVRPSVKLEN